MTIETGTKPQEKKTQEHEQKHNETLHYPDNSPLFHKIHPRTITDSTMAEREGGFRAGEGYGIGRACHSGDKGGRSQGGALTDLLGGALGQTDGDLCGIEGD